MVTVVDDLGGYSVAAWARARERRIAGWWDALGTDNRRSFLDWVARERAETRHRWTPEDVARPWAHWAGDADATDDIDVAYQLATDPD